jgi:hypothetical protein
MQCTIGEEMQYICEGKEGVQLRACQIGANVVEVAQVLLSCLTQMYLERIASVFLRLLVLYSLINQVYV